MIIKKMEMRGMRKEALYQYFLNNGGVAIEPDKIQGTGWFVVFSEEQCIKLGSIHIPATEIVFHCDKKIFNKLYNDFRMKFLTAGG